MSLAGALAAAFGAVLVSGVRAQEAPTAEQLQAVARQLSERTPMMVDGETELTSVGAAAIPADHLEAAARTAVIEKVCTNAQTRRNFLEPGIAMRYSYYDKNSRFLLSFEVTVADCRSP